MGFAVLMFFLMNKISICDVAANPTVRHVCGFHATVLGEMKLFAVL